jgi:hypothetical protein
MLKINLSEIIAQAAESQAGKNAKLAQKMRLATDPEGREWRKRDRRLRKPYNLSSPVKA